MIDSFKELLDFIRSDAYRYSGKAKYFKLYVFTPGFKYTFWMRLCTYLEQKVLLKPFYIFAYLMLLHYSYKFGIQIPHKTKIDKGFYIGHFSNIVINKRAIIGKNVNVSPGVGIGQANRGDKKGVAIIGNEVYIGPGVKIIGAVHIGNNVAIGANAVVTKDIPDNSVVVGIPARIISTEGAIGYINNKV